MTEDRFIQQYKGRTVVIKFSGKVVGDEPALRSLARQAIRLKQAGANIVLVHGGGDQIDDALDDRGITYTKQHGVRFTSAEAIGVTSDCLSGLNDDIIRVFKDECTKLGANIQPVGISGVQQNMIEAKTKFPDSHTGEVEKINTELLKSFCGPDTIPIINPICAGKEPGKPIFNVNADEVAAAVAVALNTDLLIFCSNTYIMDKNRSRLPVVKTNEIESFVDNGTFRDGVVIKARECREVLKTGRVKKIIVLNGRDSKSLEGELFGDNSYGTHIVLPSSNASVLCIGDIMLDKWRKGQSTRLSPEAPIPVVSLTKGYARLGGVGNVGRNIQALDANVSLLSVVGDDTSGRTIIKKANESSMESKLLVDSSRPTTAKTRIFSGNHPLLRADRETNKPIPSFLEDQIIEAFKAAISDHDIVIVSDYNKGVCTPRVIQEVIKTTEAYGKRVLIDPKVADWTRYAGCFLIKPNLQEFCSAANLTPPADETQIIEKAQEIKQRYNIQNIFITRGGDTGILIDRKDVVHHIPTPAVNMVDVTGAGDTNIAALATNLANGSTLIDAAIFANQMASQKVTQKGTGKIKLQEDTSVAYLEPPAQKKQEKIISQDALVEKIASMRAANPDIKIGFTNGTFTIPHKGHFHLFNECKKNCDFLVVAMNSTASLEKLQRTNSVMKEEPQRMLALARRDAVDAVVAFDNNTALELVDLIKPDIYFKGDEDQFKSLDFPEAKAVKSYGGNLMLIPTHEKGTFSASALVRKIEGLHQRRPG